MMCYSLVYHDRLEDHRFMVTVLGALRCAVVYYSIYVVCICIMYIYIYIERERADYAHTQLELCVYIYIYTDLLIYK